MLLFHLSWENLYKLFDPNEVCYGTHESHGKTMRLGSALKRFC